MSRLRTGSSAPTFRAPDCRGGVVDLEALQGSPVLLSFYRYAACPLCNLRIHELVKVLPAFEARSLKLLAVFQSPAESIAATVGTHAPPFPLVPDPDLALYRRYGVENRWLGLAKASVSASGKFLKALRLGFMPGRFEGPWHRLPADFLISPEGTLVEAYYGSDIGDHLPLVRILRYLDSA